MLHLLPVRALLTAIFALAGFAVLAAVYAGAIGTGDALGDVRWIIRLASIAAVTLLIVPYVAWRWIPGLQRVTFPYLGGEWAGELEFKGRGTSGKREIRLFIRHTLLKVVLILDSAESTSRTLVVHAERDAGVNRDRLYYVYLNERKEGAAGAGERSLGLAVLRIETEEAALFGDYFAETGGKGKLRLQMRSPNRWWVLWK